jgi:RHS repeat-associated protein
MKRFISTLILLAIGFLDVVAQAQEGGGESCSTPDYPCDQTSFCTPCPLQPPDPILTGEDGEVTAHFTRSPGAERGAYTLATLLPALASAFNYGGQLGNYQIPEGEIDDWTSDIPDQSELPDVIEGEALARATQPAFPIPPSDGILVPIDQGGPRAPSASGRPNDNTEAADKADPVNPSTGELYIDRIDLAFSGFGVEFELARTYRSRIDYSGVFGPGWDLSFNRRLLDVPDSRRRIESPDLATDYESTGSLPHARYGILGDPRGAPSAGCGPQVLYMTGQGTTLRFRQVGENATQIYYESADGVRLVLRGHKTGDEIVWSLTEPSGIVQRFDELGLLTSIRDPNGIGLAVDWEAAAVDEWRVSSVTDSVGRVIAFEYSPAGRLLRVSEPTSGLDAKYTYSAGRLASATDSTGRAEYYEYDFDATRGGGDWGPEGYLVPACELACAPSGSSCDAGGACDQPVQQATDVCVAECGGCGLACFFSECGACFGRCRGGVAGTPGCRSLCSTDCNSREYEPNVETYCNQAWTDHGRAECAKCEEECEAADDSCHWLNYCVETAGGFDNDGSSGVDPDVIGPCLDEHAIENTVELVADAVEVGLAGILDALECGIVEFCSWIPFVGELCEDHECDWRRVQDEVEDMCGQHHRRCCRDGNECESSSCNVDHGCFDDCEAVFKGNANDNDCDAPLSAQDPSSPVDQTVDQWAVANGCKPRLREVCSSRCTEECTDECSRDCIGVCAGACAEVCHSLECPAYCDSLDLMGSCQTGCVAGCIEAAHEAGPFQGAKYGYPRDLNNNIVRIRDGKRAIYLEVTYGTDLSRPDFDAVVAQTYGDFNGQIYYRDLEGEERGHVSPPTSGPAATYIESSTQFVPVDICPMACSPIGPRPNREFIAAAGNILLEFGSTGAIGGLAVENPRRQDRPIAPNVLLLSRGEAGGLTARSTGEGLGSTSPQDRPAPFNVDLPTGRVTFAPAGNRSFSLRGPAAALDALFAVGTITVFSDATGRLRVYPGYPPSLVRLASGTCREPFRAEIVSSELRIAPASACAAEIAVAPLATATLDRGTKSNVGTGGRRSLDGRDLFAASALLPARNPIAWRSIGPGRYAPYDGTDAPGGDLHRAAAVSAALNLPLSANSRDEDAPLYVYHDSTNLVASGRAGPGVRNAYFDGENGMVLDAPASSSDPLSRLCNPARPGPARRGQGARPVRATVMIDFYGVAWTYYFDEAGRVIRSVNHGTHAVRSTSYDAAGQIDGVEGPGHKRTCFNYDEYGNVLDVFDFPRATDYGRTEPIRYRYSWDVDPVRLKAVYDPRGTNLTTPPSTILESYEYDAEGNLRATQNAAGERVTFDLVGGAGPDRAMPAVRTDPDGEKAKWEYDGSTGGVSRTLIGVGRTDVVETQVVYDPGGRPVWNRSSMGEETTFDWSGGRLASILRVAGDLSETTTYSYDENSQLTLVDRGGRQTSYFYDVIGGPRRARQVAVDGSAATTNTCTRYGPSRRLLESVSPEGNRTRYTYDGEGRVTMIESGSLPSSGTWDDGCPSSFTGTAASGTVVRMAYTDSGFPWHITDAQDHDIWLIPDGFDQLAQVQHRGGYGRTGHDELGNVIWRSSYTGLQPAETYSPPIWGREDLLAAEELSYDAIGRPSQRRRWHFSQGVAIGDGYDTTRFAYDSATRSVTVTDDAGVSTTYTNDPAGRLRKIALPTGGQVLTQHLDGGRRIVRQWPAPTPSGLRHETTVLNASGQIESVTTADPGSETVLRSFEYDAHQRLVAKVDPAGHRTTLAYDALDRPTTQTVLINGTSMESIALSWNRNGWMTSRASDKDGSIATTVYTHDALGRLRQRTDPRGNRVTTDYVLASAAPNTITDERGIVTTFSYDNRQDLVGLTAARPGGPSELRTFVRDGLGRLRQATRSGGLPTWVPAAINTYVTWDSLGNRIVEQDDSSGIGGKVAHVYDGRGLVQQSTYGNNDRIIDRGYDALGRLNVVGSHQSVEPISRFTYDGLGPPIQRQDYFNGPRTRTNYQYDALGRLEKIAANDAAGAILARWRWEMPLDDVPRVAFFKQGNQPEKTSVFTADQARRVRSETHGLTGLISLPIAPDATTPAANSAVSSYVGTGSSWARYTLDGRNNVSTLAGPSGTFNPTVNLADEYTTFGARTLTYDEAGAIRTDGVGTYTYDAFGDLSSIDAGAQGKRAYVRDALGRIVLERDETAGGGNAITRYAYDGWRRHYRQLPNGTGQITVDGQGLDEHLVRLGGGTAYMYHQDRSNNVYLMTDLSGNPVEWYRYTAYGDTTIESPNGQVLPESMVGNRFGYQGQAFDADLGLVDMRHRVYHPSLGRFLTRDPIGFAGGANLYAFVGGAPLVYTDPLGLDPASPGLPPLSPPDESLYVGEGFVHKKWRAASAAADNPDNAWYQRLGAGAASVGLSLFALGEEYVGRPLANIPFTVNTVATGLGEHAARSYLFAQQGEGAEATMEGLTAVRDAAIGFVTLGSVFAPASSGPTRAGPLRTGAYLEGAEGGVGLGRLANSSIKVSEKGLAIVEEHLAQFGMFPQNTAMIGRLREALNAGESISGADASFYMHELSEATMMARGMPYDSAHAAALGKYGVSPFSIYHPAVVRSFSEFFNANWLEFWESL